jgi:hypothetical protein
MARLWNFPLKTESCVHLLATPTCAVNDYSSRNAPGFSLSSSINYSDASEQPAMHRAPSRMRAANAEGTPIVRIKR